jgi:hypothetical protein
LFTLLTSGLFTGHAAEAADVCVFNAPAIIMPLKMSGIFIDATTALVANAWMPITSHYRCLSSGPGGLFEHIGTIVGRFANGMRKIFPSDRLAVFRATDFPAPEVDTKNAATMFFLDAADKAGRSGFNLGRADQFEPLSHVNFSAC